MWALKLNARPKTPLLCQVSDKKIYIPSEVKPIIHYNYLKSTGPALQTLPSISNSESGALLRSGTQKYKNMSF